MNKQVIVSINSDQEIHISEILTVNNCDKTNALIVLTYAETEALIRELRSAQYRVTQMVKVNTMKGVTSW